MRKGLTEAEVDAALGPLEGEVPLDAATLAALRLADVLSGAAASAVDDALHEELALHYDDGQILELAAALCVGSGWQRMIEAFGIRPDLWTEATPLPFPTPPAASPAGSVVGAASAAAARLSGPVVRRAEGGQT